MARRVPAGAFERLTAPEALWEAWLRARRGKRRTPAAAAFEVDAERWIFGLRRALLSGEYQPRPYRVRVLRDPKPRPIVLSDFSDRVVHQALHAEIAPRFDRSLIDQTYACLPGRGTHRALLRYLEATRRCRFRLSLDVRRYFPSIDHGILLGLIFRQLHDARAQALVERIVRSAEGLYLRPEIQRAIPTFAEDPVPSGVGLPIGTLISQWSANLYLSGLDHFVKRTLKVRWYQRYMDDMTLFADDPGELVAAREAIAGWLASARRLRLKADRMDVVPAVEPSIYLGYRVTRAGLSVGPKAMRRFRRRLRKRAAAGREALEATLLSMRGMVLFG